jgi:hypothetical protein
MFSRNSASSRAIPFKKMVEMVWENPFIPIKWMKDHKGMQGNEYLTDKKDIESATTEWLIARDRAIQSAEFLNDKETHGVTKQICNRLLEPFMWHTVLVTATDYENFFALRYNDQAEIHMQELARVMLEEYNNSVPVLKRTHQWHIPFGNNLDIDQACKQLTETGRSYSELPELWDVKVATARCARVSYMTFDGVIDYKKDIELHDRLAASGHWSPFEHCAEVAYWDTYYGNFKGWRQYRKGFENENKSDPRVKKSEKFLSL